jgi:formylglycine-generating enzyme required for sulfatase activity
LPVLVPDGFYVDATEVTRGQYAAWLATEPSAEGQHPSCVDWNTSFEPTCGWPANTQPNLPVSCVDWCDAYAYCEGLGKRLCGRLGGGETTTELWESRNESIDQWYNACSGGGQYLWQHGQLHDPAACNGVDNPWSVCIGTGDWPTCEIFPVAALETCQSPDPAFAGIYDLSGNVMEWIDGCTGPTRDDNCRTGGGSSQHPAGSLSCEAVEVWAPRFWNNYFLGFRCCAL